MVQSTSYRPQPPSIQDPKRSNMDFWEAGIDTEPPPGIDWGGTNVPTRDEPPDDGEEYTEEDPDWDRRAQDALDFSTTYLDQNYRQMVENSIRAFNSQHASDSKYNAESYSKRSKIFVPKTRSIIRKNEAAAAAAFFSNLDRISIQGLNQSDIRQRISGDIMQALLQYRLTRSIPWFQVVIGGLQDAQVQGGCIWHAYWEYLTRRENGQLVLVRDAPRIDLKPLENIRFDPSASWMDPLNDSPYLIDMIPMYVGDVKDKMRRPDPKGQQWYEVPEKQLVARSEDDSTRAARLAPTQDPHKQNRSVSDYDIVWIHRHIHRWAGQDWMWYTLRSEDRLTDPEPLAKTVFHGKRPYIMGLAVLETHKPMPAPLPFIVKGLQDEINEIKNSRLDNVKLVLNKGYFVKRGPSVDLPALVRNAPGRLVLMNDPEKDVKEQEWSDVTASSYQEEDRNTQNFDELVGNFSAASIQMGRSPREPARAMTLLQAPANLLTEYMLKTFVETGVRPLVEQVVLLEQHYETDKVVLAIAGQKSKAYIKYGVNEITDEMIDAELTVNVNVGMGSTDPVTKLQKFVAAVTAFVQMAQKPPPGINLSEIWKEIMALSGYQDGERFTNGQDPELIKMQQTIQQLLLKLRELMMERKNKHEANVLKFQANRENNATKMALASSAGKRADVHKYADHLMAMQQLDRQAALQEQQQERQAQLASQQSTQDSGEAIALQKARPKTPANSAA